MRYFGFSVCGISTRTPFTPLRLHETRAMSDTTTHESFPRSAHVRTRDGALWPRRLRPAVALLFAILLPPSATAASIGCRIDRFDGAATPQGAVTRMHVVNTGHSCALATYGVPLERSNPATSGRITRTPVHGRADFIAPEARYTPSHGFVGEDEFDYEALAAGRKNEPLQLKVRVKVTVTAP
jgi:hypothetical protein